MTKRIRVSVELPFSGFYGSTWADQIDREETEWAEYEETEREDGELAQPEALRLDGWELVELLMRHTDHRAAHQTVAADYVEGLDALLGERLGITVKDRRPLTRWEETSPGYGWRVPIPGKFETYDRQGLGLTFEEMTSPRFYNFETDRVFAQVDLAIMRELFRRSAANGHETLRRVIDGRFTSYDGFHSHYTTALDSWLAKPLRDWDHNELGTLLRAAMADAGLEDLHEIEMDVYYDMSDSSHQAWSNAVDWTAFEAAREDARQVKLDDLADDDPDLWRQLTGGEMDIPLIRCPHTLDLFAGQSLS